MVGRERLHDLLFRKQSSSTWQHALEVVGCLFPFLRCQFSADLASWFLEKFPEQVGPDEAQADHTHLSSLMQSVLPGIEFHDATQGKTHFMEPGEVVEQAPQESGGIALAAGLDETAKLESALVRHPCMTS